MSTSAQTPGKGQPSGQAGRSKRSQREIARTVSIAVLAILITLFAVFNLSEVKVSYVFGSGRAPLIVVIVISVVFGIVLTYLAERLQRKKSR
jgi:lipopolysaccharide assembly protein A